MNLTELISYVEWLVQTNESLSTTELADNVYFYLFGALSEVYELLQAPEDKRIYEAGDVLAYSTLSLFALGQSAEEIATNLSNHATVPNVQLVLTSLTNALAKHYRGDTGTYKEEAIAHLYNLTHWAATYTSVSAYVLSVYNRQKLANRIASTGTLQGKGER